MPWVTHSCKVKIDPSLKNLYPDLIFTNILI